MPERAPYGTAQTLLRQLIASQTDECLLWPYGKMANGYGRVKVDGFTHNAHRLVCAWKHGPPERDGLEAAHSCGNRACVNPRHIRWATPAENAADRIIHGTDSRCGRNSGAKLTADQVLAIRASDEQGVILAKRYGVSSTNITLIRQRRKWKSLEQA